MTLDRYSRYLLPITLGVLGILLLIRIFLVDTTVLIPEDVDIVLLVFLLAAGMIMAVHTIVGISMGHLRRLSVQRARRETLAEHNRFLRRLDHELKNPLTTLRAGLRTLEVTGLNEQQEHIVGTMETETLRLSRLVTDLRKLVELETQPLNMQPVNIEAFITNIMQIEQERFEAGERTLESSLDLKRKTWGIDEDVLALAVHNLLDNAFKYTRPGDTVNVIVSTQQELTITVSDTGQGISESDLPHVWEELYRAEQAEKLPGSGIGLALVKTIVERHDGVVSIESEPDRGTEVSIRLPLVSQL